MRLILPLAALMAILATNHPTTSASVPTHDAINVHVDQVAPAADVPCPVKVATINHEGDEMNRAQKLAAAERDGRTVSRADVKTNRPDTTLAALPVLERAPDVVTIRREVPNLVERVMVKVLREHGVIKDTPAVPPGFELRDEGNSAVPETSPGVKNAPGEDEKA